MKIGREIPIPIDMFELQFLLRRGVPRTPVKSIDQVLRLLNQAGNADVLGISSKTPPPNSNENISRFALTAHRRSSANLLQQVKIPMISLRRKNIRLGRTQMKRIDSFHSPSPQSDQMPIFSKHVPQLLEGGPMRVEVFDQSGLCGRDSSVAQISNQSHAQQQDDGRCPEEPNENPLQPSHQNLWKGFHCLDESHRTGVTLQAICHMNGDKTGFLRIPDPPALTGAGKGIKLRA
jgi:hypothetical protein